MKLKNIIATFILIFICINVFSQNSETGKMKSGLIIKEINFIDLKYTKEKYLISRVLIKPGSKWNKNIKDKTIDELNSMENIIKDYKIEEKIINDNEVIINITINEKIPFLVIPFFTYSTSDGIKPQIKLWSFNTGGINKYIESELEFHPKDDIHFYFLYKDPSVMNNNNLNYKLIGEFYTSILNYYANVTQDGYPRGILPPGVINGDKNDKWNDEFYIRGVFQFNLMTKIPIYDITINPEIKIDYNSIRIADEAGELPIHEVVPSGSIKFSFPLKSINSYIKPSFNFEYNLKVGDEKSVPDENYYLHGKDQIIPSGKLEFKYLIPYIKADLAPYVELIYTRTRDLFYVRNSTPTDIDYYVGDTIDLILGLKFKKSFTRGLLTHSFELLFEYEQRLLGATSVDRDDYTQGPFYFNFKSLFDFIYNFELAFLQQHKFKMKYYFFARYNQEEEFGDYDFGEDPGEFDAWIGLICNLKYELPLFKIDTTKFITLTMKEQLLWQVFWDFYVDFGLAAGSEDDEDVTIYTLGDYLHLNPAFGLGTGIRILPNFVPITIDFKLGSDIYRFLKRKSFTLYFEFSIEAQI